MADERITFTLNGEEVDARPGELVIAAAERHGTYIPHFCYHPRMRPVGMCRMCVVDIDTGRGTSLQPACMLEVTDGMVVDTNSETTVKAQDGILEFLLINHPLDCPVCDKGGECPLQDQTMAYGPGESRFVEAKRHHEKPIPISDLVLLDRERCILCDRCTRFADEVAGDPLISFIGRGSHTEVNTFPDEPFASYFSGNTVQICPVGALTATPYRFKARPWDLEQSESTCQTCSVGCRVAVQSSRNQVLRYLGVDSDPVNWGWLCDKGRFAFESVNSEDRLDTALVRNGDGLTEVRWAEGLRAAASALRSTVEESGPEALGVIGGARLTNEDAYAWAKLTKGVLGCDNTDAQLGDGLAAELALGLPRATIDDVCRSGGTVVVVAPDIKEELPVLYLRLRHAVVNDEVKIIEIGPSATGLSHLAAASLRCRPGEVAAAVRAVLGGEPAAEANLDGADVDAARSLLAAASAEVSVVLGRQSVAESEDYIADAAGALLEGLDDPRFLVALRRGNVHGALDMGLAPGMLPGRVTLEEGTEWFSGNWSKVPAARGLDTRGILTEAAAGRIRTLVLLGADPLGDFPDQDLARRALEGAGTVIATDAFRTRSVEMADVALPVAGFAEVGGTTTNLEGRVSPLSQQVTPPGVARTDWSIAAELALLLGADLGFESVEQIWDEIERLAPSHAGLTRERLETAADGLLAPLRPEPHLQDETPGPVVGGEAVEPAVEEEAAEDVLQEQAAAAEAAGATAEQVAAAEATETEPEPAGPPDAPEAPARPPTVTFTAADPVALPQRDAYSLRLLASRTLYDEGVATQRSPGLAGLAPGTRARLSRPDADQLGVGTGDTVRLTSARGALSVEAQVDDGLPKGVVGLWFNQPGTSASELIDSDAAVTEVRIETGGSS